MAFFNTANKFIDTSFIGIVTYASFVKQKFQSIFQLLPQDTLLVADEVHNMGAKSVSKLLSTISLGKRIGLSATPERKYDDESNIVMQKFFNDKPPYVYSYTMREAIYNNPPALCKYSYYPHIVFLSSYELEEYIKISKQLLKFLDSFTGKFKDCQEVEMLLLKRKRIIHKAENKKEVFKQIIAAEFKKRKNLKYTLVYVPEGLETDYSNLDEYNENEEELHLINEYTKIVSATDKSIMVKQYTSNSKDRDNILKDFANGKVHVMTSMKCLDEGVDIPRAELAIFCASTGNPRQFIQRRGRVLRLHKDKVHAVIHDLIVVPLINNESDTFEMERHLVERELERVVDFSSLSMNKMDTYEILEEIKQIHMTRKDDILSNVLKHEMLKDKYHLSQKAMPKTIKEALSSSNPIIKSIALLIDNLENTTPTSDTVLRNIITQYLNESAL
jgi:superfamily II DNA or RNA helicase